MKKSNALLLIALGSILAILLAFLIFLGVSIRGMIDDPGHCAVLSLRTESTLLS